MMLIQQSGLQDEGVVGSKISYPALDLYTSTAEEYRQRSIAHLVDDNFAAADAVHVKAALVEFAIGERMKFKYTKGDVYPLTAERLLTMPLRGACGLPVTRADEDAAAERTGVCGRCFHTDDVANDTVVGYPEALAAVCADIRARKSEPSVTYMCVPHPSTWDLREAPDFAKAEPKPTKRRVSMAAMWQEDEDAEAAKARNVRISFSGESAPGRFSGVAAVDKDKYDGVVFGICEPIVARVQRGDSNGPQSPILRCVEENI
jgi:hypothetical protein